MKKRPHITIKPKKEDPGSSIRLKAKPGVKPGFSFREFFRKGLSHLPKWAFERSFLLAAGGIILVFLMLIILSQRSQEIVYEDEVLPMPEEAVDSIKQLARLDIPDEGVNLDRTIIKADELLGAFLLKQKIPQELVDELVGQANELGIREVKQGADIFIYFSAGSTPVASPEYIIYRPEPALQVYLYVSPVPLVKLEQKPVEIKINSAAVIIKDKNFFNAVVDNDLPRQIIPSIEKALQWSVDLYHIDIGDKFRVVYEGHYAEDKLVDVGRILAVYFQTKNKEFYAFNVQKPGSSIYFDADGNSMVRTFLKSPVKFGFVSSRYDLKRLHPVLKEVRPHYGTDYAAPLGTPIFAVSDGRITKAENKAGNGNYVKIAHAGNIETQYLHMSRFQEGIRPGVWVRQGEIIGYVGQTGLATGPHVCFRLWKGGKQVDPFMEPLDTPDPPLNMQEVDRFFALRDSLMPLLKKAKYADMDGM